MKGYSNTPLIIFNPDGNNKPKPKPYIKAVSVFGCSEIEVSDGVNAIAIQLTKSGVESLIEELQIVLSMED